MPIISVAHGWQHILDEAVAEASKLPEEWLLEIVHARRVDGMLDLWATYAARDIPLDDYLPADKKIPHPYRSFIRIRDKARQKSLVTCECCGRMGKVIGAGDEARVRCAAHADVEDAMSWEPPEGALFASDEEAMAHFLSDFGDGLDAMQELARGDDDDTRN